MSKNNKYGYLTDVAQSFGNNKGVFDINEIYDLNRSDKWTHYGQLELIHSEAVSSVTSVEFKESSGSFDTSYDVHLVTVSNFTATTTSSTSGAVRLIESGTVATSGYMMAQWRYDNSYQSAYEEKSTGTTNIGIPFDYDPQTSRNCYFIIYNASDPAKSTFVNFHYSGINNGGQVTRFGGGLLQNSSIVDGFEIFSTVTNFDIDRVSIYGMKKF